MTFRLKPLKCFFFLEVYILISYCRLLALREMDRQADRPFIKDVECDKFIKKVSTRQIKRQFRDEAIPKANTHSLIHSLAYLLVPVISRRHTSWTREDPLLSWWLLLMFFFSWLCMVFGYFIVCVFLYFFFFFFFFITLSITKK